MRIATSIVLVCCAVCFGQPETPRVFADLAFEEALAQADGADRLLVVNAMRTGDGPSERIAETWANEAIEVFVRDNAVAIQIDIDDQTWFAEEYDIQATPTVVVFRNGREYVRRAGYMDAGDALAWLDAARAGNAFGAASIADEIRERLNEVRSVLYGSNPEDAIDDYLELWREAGLEGQWLRTMREYEMALDLEELVYMSDEAMERVTEVRDQTEARLREDPNWRDLGGWIVLSDVIDDPEPVFGWIDRNKVDEEGRETIRFFADLVENMLIEYERWQDYGLIVEYPLGAIEEWHEEMELTREIMAEEGDEDGSWAETLAFETDIFTETAANVHAALLAADRDDDAWEVAEAAISMEDTGDVRSAIVLRAIEAGVAEERHRDLLEGEGTEAAREELEEALG